MYAQSAFEKPLQSPGVGLRGPHIHDLLDRQPDVGWLEVHPENYMAAPAALAMLERTRTLYPVSLHGVSMSLGSAHCLDIGHLTALKSLVDRLDPFLVSEHLAWSAVEGAHLNDLLPLPYTEEALEVMVSHVDQIQNALGRTILIENPSTYLRFQHSTMTEGAFLAALSASTGCGILLDVNNLSVSAHNVALSLTDYFDVLPGSAIGEIHLAGHAVNHIGERTILIDDHGSPVTDDVWALYVRILERYGYRPTLVEWDTNIPPLEILVAESLRARDLSRCAVGACRADIA